jgi:N-acetylglucosaminyldiphosphoundecaprenol N-acetyl-beta-D-mannosaminyltransferase
MSNDSPAPAQGPQTLPELVESLHGNVLGIRVAALTMHQAVGAILDWGHKGAGGYVCFAPVHSIMEARDNPEMKSALDNALMVCPDGGPVASLVASQGHPKLQRLSGPDAMVEVCQEAAKRGTKIGLYGSTPETLESLAANLVEQIPNLHIAYTHSPPFKVLSQPEKDQTIQDITDSGVEVLFVGLGCPKQELWMRENAPLLKPILLGVGAAFDFHAGKLSRAPDWMRNNNLEWLFRLASEPKRLFGRYAKHNPRFLWLSFLQRAKLRSF